jgi:hypothetical protein
MVFNRFFQFWTYKPSLSILYLRSNKQNSITIDIEFYNVSYIDLPTYLYIKSISYFDTNKTIEKITIRPKEYEIVYEIKNLDGQSFYIFASKCVIGRSKMEYDEHPTISKNCVYNDIVVL